MADIDWELRESGPSGAERTVLLLPGGMCSAGSFAEIMAAPVLSDTRLVAATLPGNAGAPPLNDCSIENYARITTELATELNADAVVGFSNGASVAFEMVVSGRFTGPVVLLGISLSSEDEAGFFRGLVKLSTVLGGVPSRLLSTGAAAMVKRTDLPAERKRELRADFRRNVPRDITPALRAYVHWLHRQEQPAERLCQAGIPAWIVHAERGDGGLTDDERRTLEGCAQAHVVTIRGSVFFLPNEAPAPLADVIAEAVGGIGAPG
jgi:pimeloyl-ACP methyl ester carboxylesterase